MRAMPAAHPASMSLTALERSGLLFVDEAVAVGEDPRRFRELAGRGVLVRVRRGAYCLRSAWDLLDEREKHILRVRAAVHDLRTGEPLVAGRSAAALWGMPTLGDWPPEVQLLAPYRNGGKSEPGVHRSAAGFGGATRSTIDGIAVTSLVRTAFDLGRTEGFVAGVMAVDWVRREHDVSLDELRDELGRSQLRAGHRALDRIIDFSNPLAATPGESAARAVIHQLGFEAPELQVEFRDSQGRMETDFFWRRVRVVGEFDGKMKYTRSEYTGGDPAEVVWREKKREDRLRRQVNGVARILWEHVMHPRDLASVLIDAGVPRGR
jgi:predicted transcriptional regulator of viral defense system